MTEKDILKQLKSLKGITPDPVWKQRSRDLLLAQVGGSGAESVSGNFLLGLREVVRTFAVSPAVLVMSLAVLVFGGSAFGVLASRNTKPGDSLYLAKRATERTQLALTFDQTEKVKLNIEFAGKRAQEMKDVIAATETDETTDEKDKKVEILTESFKQEIKVARQKLETIKKPARPAIENIPAAPDAETPTAEPEVFGAGLQKDDRGIQISDTPESSTATPAVKAIPALLASTTTEADATTTPALAPEPAKDASAILTEAEQLFDEKEIDKAMDKLNEATDLINNPLLPPAASSTSMEDASKVEAVTEDKATTTK